MEARVHARVLSPLRCNSGHNLCTPNVREPGILMGVQTGAAARPCTWPEVNHEGPVVTVMLSLLQGDGIHQLCSGL